MKKMMLMAMVMMAVVTVNAQSSKKDRVYNFFGKPAATHNYYSKAELSRLTTTPKTGNFFRFEKLNYPKNSVGVMYYPNYLGKSGIALVGTTGWMVGHNVATSLVATIGSSLENAHLSGIRDYALSGVDGSLHGAYSTENLKCKTIDVGLANQWEIGQLRIFKSCALSLFGGVFAKVSIEHGTETYNKVSYEETSSSAYYQGGYNYFILSCGSQLGANVKLGKWTLSVSENLTNGLWRDCTRPLGPSKLGLIDLGSSDTYHLLSTNVGVTLKIR